MSTTTSQSANQASSDKPAAFQSQWKNSNNEPSAEKKEQARQESLNIGNKTEIGHDEVSETENEEINYERLDEHNRDNRWEYRADINVAKESDQQIKLHLTKGIASQLGLSEFHKQLVINRIFEMDGQRFGERLEPVAFCLCAIVLNDEIKHREYREKVYHPQRSDSNNDQEFVRVQNQLINSYGPLTKNRLQSIYAKLSQGHAPNKKDGSQAYLRQNDLVQRRPSYPPPKSLPRPSSD